MEVHILLILIVAPTWWSSSCLSGLAARWCSRKEAELPTKYKRGKKLKIAIKDDIWGLADLWCPPPP